jgi:RNA recognition motif-containing protein
MTQRRKSLKSRKIATKKPRAPQILLSVSLTKEYIPIISSKF